MLLRNVTLGGTLNREPGGLTEKGTFEGRHERGEGESHLELGGVGGERHPRQRNSKCKDPESGAFQEQ